MRSIIKELSMDDNFDAEDNESLRPKKRRKKNGKPLKKNKYILSKLIEYESYITSMEMFSKENDNFGLK